MPYHGGAVQPNATVHIVYWGRYWASGSDAAPLYLDNLFQHLGQTHCTRTVSQYCWHTGGVVFRAAEYQFSSDLLWGVSDDPSRITGYPSPTAAEIGAEALAQNPNLTTPGHKYPVGYPTTVVVTPPGIVPVEEKKNGCGMHFLYAYKDPNTPRQTDWMNVIDLPWGVINTSFPSRCWGGGHGALSTIAGHEWAEAATDPGVSWVNTLGNGATPGRAAWVNFSSNEHEIGDICESAGQFKLTLGGNTYTMQRLWSNNANSGHGGCVYGS